MNKYLIYGCMFSGKTSKMISLIKYCKLKYKVFVHALHGSFTSHNKISIHQYMCANEILPQIGDAQIVFVDEIQFFPIEEIKKLLELPIIIYFSGLNMDFNGDKFPTTDYLINNLPPQNITYLRSICECGQSAEYSKLRIAKPKKNNIIIGGSDLYKPACENCF